VDRATERGVGEGLERGRVIRARRLADHGCVDSEEAGELWVSVA